MKIGVLGGGQLGRMMALAGYPLGLQFRFFEKSPGSPASQVAECRDGDFGDEQALASFAEGLDLVTYEFENVPVSAARFLSIRTGLFFPPPEALEMAQDRYVQKQFFQRLGVPTSLFCSVATRNELETAAGFTGFPAVLKTRRWGYDGKGQMVLREPSDLDRAWAAMDSTPLILESFVAFEREVSLISARSRSGETAFYPLTENRHREGILRVSLAPADHIDPRLQSHAQEYAEAVFRELRYVGVLTIEFFEVGGKLLANEMATRVHNSGHWTIEGADTSQFENHLRAITGMPLGSPVARGASAMINFIGSVPSTQALLATPGAHLHLYGKSPRPGRKLGHVTLCRTDARQLQCGLAAVERLVRDDNEVL